MSKGNHSDLFVSRSQTAQNMDFGAKSTPTTPFPKISTETFPPQDGDNDHKSLESDETVAFGDFSGSKGTKSRVRKASSLAMEISNLREFSKGQGGGFVTGSKESKAMRALARRYYFQTPNDQPVVFPSGWGNDVPSPKGRLFQGGSHTTQHTITMDKFKDLYTSTLSGRMERVVEALANISPGSVGPIAKRHLVLLHNSLAETLGAGWQDGWERIYSHFSNS